MSSGEAHASDDTARGVAPWTTGSTGLDAMLAGGVPARRVTAIVGGPGAGKTVLAMQTVAAQAARGVRSVFVALEQSAHRLREDMAHFTWAVHLGDAIVEVVEATLPRQAVAVGDFDLEGLIAVLADTVERLGAEIVVLDGIDALLSMLADEEAERREIFRVCAWIRDQELTGIITTKSSETWQRSQERTALIDYHSDCVVVLDSTQTLAVSSRSARVSKLRGSAHDSDTAPMLITADGVQATPLHTMMLSEAPRTDRRRSTGIDELDEMLHGGYLEGSATLLSGPPGTAKTTLSTAFFAHATRTEQGIYVSFDETEAEIVFHMASVGYDLSPALAEGRARVLSFTSGAEAPETQIAAILHAVDEHAARVVVIDPISSLLTLDSPVADRASAFLMAQLDARGVTVVATTLLADGSASGELSKSRISTLADNWIHLTYVAHGGERNRSLTIVKARGTANSNQVRELVIGEGGARPLSVYLADGEVLTGSARVQREAADRRARHKAQIAFDRGVADRDAELVELEIQRKQVEREIARKRGDQEQFRRERSELLARDAADEDERRRTRVHGGEMA